MNYKLITTLFLAMMCLVTLDAQRTSFGYDVRRSSVESQVKIEIGMNRSQIAPTALGNEEINGGIGWQGNLLYSLETSLFCIETGIGYRSLNFLISENQSDTQQYSAKATSLSIPFMLGSNFAGSNRNNFAPILKIGARLDYMLGLSNERTDVLMESDLEEMNYTFEANFGLRFNRIELLVAYNEDIKNYIKTIDEKNKYIGLKLAFNFLD